MSLGDGVCVNCLSSEDDDKKQYRRVIYSLNHSAVGLFATDGTILCLIIVKSHSNKAKPVLYHVNDDMDNDNAKIKGTKFRALFHDCTSIDDYELIFANPSLDGPIIVQGNYLSSWNEIPSISQQNIINKTNIIRQTEYIAISNHSKVEDGLKSINQNPYLHIAVMPSSTHPEHSQLFKNATWKSVGTYAIIMNLTTYNPALNNQQRNIILKPDSTLISRMLIHADPITPFILNEQSERLHVEMKTLLESKDESYQRVLLPCGHKSKIECLNEQIDWFNIVCTTCQYRVWGLITDDSLLSCETSSSSSSFNGNNDNLTEMLINKITDLQLDEKNDTSDLLTQLSETMRNVIADINIAHTQINQRGDVRTVLKNGNIRYALEMEVICPYDTKEEQSTWLTSYTKSPDQQWRQWIKEGLMFAMHTRNKELYDNKLKDTHDYLQEFVALPLIGWKSKHNKDLSEISNTKLTIVGVIYLAFIKKNNLSKVQIEEITQ